MKTPDECAYCGSRKVAGYASGESGPFVYCSECHAMGPSRPTRDEAVEAWNRVARAVRMLRESEMGGEAS